jgi:hypothetical protein
MERAYNNGVVEKVVGPISLRDKKKAQEQGLRFFVAIFAYI